MLDQRITKLVLFLYYNATGEEIAGPYRLDSLQKLITRFEANHQLLMGANSKSEKNAAMDSLFSKATNYLIKIVTSGRQVLAHPTPDVLKKSIEELALVELPFLLTMEKIVYTYQKESTAKLNRLKNLELAFSVIVLVILISQFYLIILPIFRQLQASNRLMKSSNAVLAKSEATVKQERILLRTIIDNIPINIYAKNKNSQKIIANKAEYEYMQAHVEGDILGKSDPELYPSFSASISLEEDKRVFSGEPMINMPTLNTRKDGSQTWFLASKIPLRDVKGEVTGLVGISIDITEEKIAQEELARKEKLYRLVTENSQDVVSLHTIEGVFTYVSPACVSLHGYSPEELVGKIGTDFIHPEDAKIIEAQASSVLEKMKRGEALEPMSFRLASKHRGLIWVENLIKPIFENDQLIGFQSTIRDISIRKAYEAQLHDARLRAEEATLAKSQFLSMMSHEIRTPLNGIVGLTNLLIDENPRAEQLEKLKLLKFSCDNLLAIINDILDFSKAEAGKMELEKITFDLKELLHHYVNLLRNSATQKKIELNLIMEGSLPENIVGDPVRLGQVLNNLISNAIKFTEKGSVEVAVKLVRTEPDFSVFHFSVKDSGIGIPSDKIQFIFEGFSQASSDTTRKFGGTGLGLSITRKILTLMDSDIQVQSTMGVGSEFWFELKMKKAPDILKQNQTEGLTINYKHVRLLLVEDNPINQVVAKNFMDKWGFTTTVAHEGKEALLLLTSKNFDLVLMDIHMPIMNGYEATRQIRANGDAYFKQLPIIALTADVSSEIRARAMASGMTDLMTKPFQPNELYAILEKYLPEKIIPHTAPKLFPKLKIYSEGNKKFEQELVDLLIKNIFELDAGVSQLVLENKVEVFNSVIHKSKTAISILDDNRLYEMVEELKSAAQHFLKDREVMPQHLLDDFSFLKTDLINKLENRVFEE